MKPSTKMLETMISTFANTKGIQKLQVLEDLLDYTIGYLDPTGQPVEGWKYTKKDNAAFFDMLRTYLKVMEDKLIVNDWYDAFGDLYMSLVPRGGGKGQFFTPVDMCNLMAETQIRRDHVVEGQMTNFGRRIVVNDPAAGSSRCLLAANAKIINTYKQKPYLVAEDLDAMCCKMSAVNLALHGCFGEVVCHDTLCEPMEMRIGYIIGETNYPFTTNIPSIRRVKDKSKYFLFQRNENRTEGKKTPSDVSTADDAQGKIVQLSLF